MVLSLVGVLVLFFFAESPQALDIYGWWKVKFTVDQGDFQTGEWVGIKGAGKKAAYLYFSNSPPPYGSAVLLIWDDASNDYIREPAEQGYAAYIYNNIVVLSLGAAFDDNGVPLVGGTIVLKPYGTSYLPYMMRGYYTVYDRETEGTEDQFVRMGSLSATRVQPAQVPELAKEKVPPP